MAERGHRAVDKFREDLFWRVRNLVDSKTRVAVIPTRSRPEREERIEFLIDQDASHSDSEIALTVANQRRIQNCGMQSNSFLATWGEGQVLQVFIHRIEAEAFDFALNYRSYGRVGDFIGSMVRHAGFRVAPDALYYMNPEAERGYGVLVTHDFGALLALFGLDAKAFADGAAGGFEDQISVYRFLVASAYFCPEAYKPAIVATKTANKPSHKMMAQARFYRWLTAPERASLMAGQRRDQAGVSAEMLVRAKQQFPMLAEVLSGVTPENRESVFNSQPDRRSALEQVEAALGDLEQLRVEADITSRPAFRMAVRALRDELGGRAELDVWLRGNDRAKVIAHLLALRADLKPTGYQQR